MRPQPLRHHYLSAVQHSSHFFTSLPTTLPFAFAWKHMCHICSSYTTWPCWLSSSFLPTWITWILFQTMPTLRWRCRRRWTGWATPRCRGRTRRMTSALPSRSSPSSPRSLGRSWRTWWADLHIGIITTLAVKNHYGGLNTKIFGFNNPSPAGSAHHVW